MTVLTSVRTLFGEEEIRFKRERERKLKNQNSLHTHLSCLTVANVHHNMIRTWLREAIEEQISHTASIGVRRRATLHASISLKTNQAKIKRLKKKKDRTILIIPGCMLVLECIVVRRYEGCPTSQRYCMSDRRDQSSPCHRYLRRYHMNTNIETEWNILTRFYHLPPHAQLVPPQT